LGISRKVGIKITNIASGDNHTLAILNTLEDDEKKEEKEENKNFLSGEVPTIGN